MIILKDICYVRLGTIHLRDAVEYANQVVGIDIVRKDPSGVYLSSDRRDHTLCYFDGDPSDHVTGFEVEGPEALAAAAVELDAFGIAVAEGSPLDCEARHVDQFIRFRDPSGNQIELVRGVRTRQYALNYGRDVGITEFSHIGLRSTDPARDETFWTQICNARVSDRIGTAPLLRIDAVHHKVALFPSKHPGVQHINHQLATIDEVMRAWYRLKALGVRIVFGPGRHPTSNAIFLYYEGPDGMVYEYSTGVRHITDPGHQPRQFPFEAASFCMWGAEPDIPEFR